MTTVVPPGQAAVAGQPGQAGSVNQFAVTHPADWIPQGTLQDSQATPNAANSSTLTQWLSQSFTTGSTQTAIGYVILSVLTSGGSGSTDLITPLLLSVYADDGGGLPLGPALVTTPVSNSYIFSSPSLVPFPLPVTGLVPNTLYHLVIEMAGTSGHFYEWNQSNQTAGAAVSPDGISWTASSFGFLFQIYDNIPVGPTWFLYEDLGTRWTYLTWNGDGTLHQIWENTIGQIPTASLFSVRTLTYSGGNVTAVS